MREERDVERVNGITVEHGVNGSKADLSFEAEDGSDFLNGSVVMWRGNQIGFTSGSPTDLCLTITDEDLENAEMSAQDIADLKKHIETVMPMIIRYGYNLTT